VLSLSDPEEAERLFELAKKDNKQRLSALKDLSE
jgi:hypothetical protein